MNLTQKLKLLKNIHPQKKWLQDTKDLFLMQAKNELFFRKQEGEILNFAFWKLFFRPISALGAIMLLFLEVQFLQLIFQKILYRAILYM